jgi:hypothetical protein
MLGRNLVVFLSVACVVAAGGACGASSKSGAIADAGGTDSSSSAPDTGRPETSPPAQEDGESNGDSGATNLDASDGAPPSATVPAIACTNAVGDVYVTPNGLPPMDMSLRGTIISCALDSVFSTSDVAAKLSAKSVTGVVPTSGTTTYRIAYRTYRDDGVPGLATARVYLPSTPRSVPMPVIAIGHPTVGMAPSCAPSMNATDDDDLALPWAAHGFAVIDSDYAGLGNAGVQGYTDNHDQAHSVLDAARALRLMLDPSVLDQRVLLAGYSQGGGAVLASQGLAGSYGAGGNVIAVVVYAAEYFSRNNSFQYQQMLENPTELTITTGVTEPVVATSRDYAFAYNVLGPSLADATFPASGTGIGGSIMSLCEVPYGGYIQGVAPVVSDLFDDGFRTSLLACMGVSATTDDGGAAICAGVGSQFYNWMQSDLVKPDPAGAPILYVQGGSDSVMPPAQEAACNIAEIQAAGVPVQVCYDPPAEHTTVVPRNAGFALQWGETTIYGGSLPTCSSSGMPACQP